MYFLSLAFIVFFLTFLLLFSFHKKTEIRKILLLAANFIAYALIDRQFFLVLLASSFFFAFFGKALQRNRSKGILAAGILLPVALLVLARWKGNLFAPVGLSFFLLQGISYLVDLYRGKILQAYPVRDVMIYVSFFPLVISGPIMKARDFLPQLNAVSRPDWQRISIGMQRFLLGLFEKLVIADRLSVAVNAVYGAPAAYSGGTLLFTAFLYMVRLYFDFAGYSHMAIALANLLGFRICENFDLPFLATNFSEFWKRWHISLSSWLTEYVYFSVGGSRKGELRTCLNLLLTMFVSGLWHGFSFGFILWGLLNGLILVIQRFYRRLSERKKKEQEHPVGKILAQCLNSIVVVLIFIPFALGDYERIAIVIRRICLMAQGVEYYFVYGMVFLPVLILDHILGEKKAKGHNWMKYLDLMKMKGKILFVLLVFLTVLFAYFGNTAFIYEQF